MQCDSSLLEMNDDDGVTPGGDGGDVEGEEEKEVDPDMLEDTFDDIDNL